MYGLKEACKKYTALNAERLRFDTKNLMNQPINIQRKSPKLLSQQTRKRYYKNLGTVVISSTMSPPSQLSFLLLLVEHTFCT